jgi:hypothetical protein
VNPCECGCGTPVKKRYVNGHWARTPAGRENWKRALDMPRPVTASKLSKWDDLEDVIRQADLTYTDDVEIEDFVCPCLECSVKTYKADIELRKWAIEAEIAQGKRASTASVTTPR